MSKEMMGPGCAVTMLGRAGLRYREGPQTVYVDGEMLTGPFGFVIYANSIRVWEGTKTPIDDAKRKEIVASILVPEGKHTWDVGDVCLAWDPATYGNALTAKFFASDGKDIYYLSHPKTHGCLASGSGDFLE